MKNPLPSREMKALKAIVDSQEQWVNYKGKPNYPVPAIPLEIIFGWEWSEIDWTNQAYVTVIRKHEWSDKHFEGSFVTEYGPWL